MYSNQYTLIRYVQTKAQTTLHKPNLHTNWRLELGFQEVNQYGDFHSSTCLKA